MASREVRESVKFTVAAAMATGIRVGLADFRRQAAIVFRFKGNWPPGSPELRPCSTEIPGSAGGAMAFVDRCLLGEPSGAFCALVFECPREKVPALNPLQLSLFKSGAP